jgi:hypothetical protein
MRQTEVFMKFYFGKRRQGNREVTCVPVSLAKMTLEQVNAYRF